MKHWKRKTALAVTALLLLTGGGYYALSEAGESTAAERAAAVDLDLPLSAYRLTNREQSDARHADSLLVRACMEKAGFSWYAPVTPLRPDPLRRRYGVIDPEVAQLYGYHPPPDEISARIAGRRLEILKNPEADKAYHGPEKNRQQGCAARAGQELSPRVEEITNTLADRLSWQSLEASAKRPEVVAAHRAWQKCMSARGYHYATPDDAILDKAWNLESSVIGEKERAVAVADVACKYEVDLVEIRVAAETDIQREMIAKNASGLKTLDEKLRAYRKNVRSVLEHLDTRTDD